MNVSKETTDVIVFIVFILCLYVPFCFFMSPLLISFIVALFIFHSSILSVCPSTSLFGCLPVCLPYSYRCCPTLSNATVDHVHNFVALSQNVFTYYKEINYRNATICIKISYVWWKLKYLQKDIPKMTIIPEDVTFSTWTSSSWAM